MKTLFMRFPEGRAKALTLSYDDGVEQDLDLMEILDRYGLKPRRHHSPQTYRLQGCRGLR